MPHFMFIVTTRTLNSEIDTINASVCHGLNTSAPPQTDEQLGKVQAALNKMNAELTALAKEVNPA